jgi:hypothetical protein
MAHRKHRIPSQHGISTTARSPKTTRARTARRLRERRAHRRYTLKKGAFAMLQARTGHLDDISGMSMGQIGMAVIKSKPVIMGEIKNVSRSGLSFHYPAGRGQRPDTRKIDILLAESAICLKGLNFKTIADTEVDEGRPYAPIKTKQQQIQFIDLTDRQKAMLEHLIRTHADKPPSSQ